MPKLKDLKEPATDCVKWVDGYTFSLHPMDSKYSISKPIPNTITLVIAQVEEMYLCYLRYSVEIDKLSSSSKEENEFPEYLMTKSENKKLLVLKTRPEVFLKSLFDMGITKEELSSGSCDNNSLVKEYYNSVFEYSEYLGKLQATLKDRISGGVNGIIQNHMSKFKLDIFIIATRKYDSEGNVILEYTQEEILASEYFTDQVDIINDLFNEVLKKVIEHSVYAAKKQSQSLEAVQALIGVLGADLKNIKEKVIKGQKGGRKSESMKKSSSSQDLMRRKLEKLGT